MNQHMNPEEIQDLINLLQVAHEDASALQSQSHDHEEIQAYKEHKQALFKWIVRLSAARDAKEASQ